MTTPRGSTVAGTRATQSGHVNLKLEPLGAPARAPSRASGNTAYGTPRQRPRPRFRPHLCLRHIEQTLGHPHPCDFAPAYSKRNIKQMTVKGVNFCHFTSGVINRDQAELEAFMQSTHFPSWGTRPTNTTAERLQRRRRWLDCPRHQEVAVGFSSSAAACIIGV